MGLLDEKLLSPGVNAWAREKSSTNKDLSISKGRPLTKWVPIHRIFPACVIFPPEPETTLEILVAFRRVSQ
jgi:hypothetical protein